MARRFRALLVVAALLALLLCVRAEEPGVGSSNKTLNVGGVTRSYILHEPANRKADAKLPLVIALHGGLGNGVGTERWSKFSELADKEGFVVVYPDGLERHWNDGRKTTGANAPTSEADDLGFISALIDEMVKNHGADPKRVYATGISNGAIFSQHLAMHLADKIAAVCSVCGAIPVAEEKEFAPSQPVSVMVMNGTKDPLVLWDGGEIKGGKGGPVISTEETIKKWVAFDHCNATATEDPAIDNDANDGTRVIRYNYKNGKQGTEVVLVKVEGGGHTWPKGHIPLPEKLVGKTSQEIDATAVIWEFFKKHAKE